MRRTLKILRGPDEPAPVDHSHDALLTVDEAARRLRIGRTLFYALIKTGALPVVRFPGSRLVRVSAASLERFISDQVGA